MNRRSFRARAVGSVAHRMDTTGVDPTVIEVEQGTDGNGVVDGFIGETGFVKNNDIFGLNIDRIFIYLFHKTEQSLVGIGEGAGFDILHYSGHKGMIIQ